MIKQLVRFYRRSVLRDPFLLAVRQWKRDQGDQILRLDYPLTSQSVVLDVGGYMGDFAAALHEKFGCRVLIFEPMPQFDAICRQRFASNSSIEVFNFGLGASDEELQLSDSADASSFCREGTAEGSVAAQIRDVSTVWQELELGQVDLMKINIEGGEYPLLERMVQTGLVDQVNNLQVQFHNFVPAAESRRNAVRSQLSQTHEENWCYDFVWENWQRGARAA